MPTEIVPMPNQWLNKEGRTQLLQGVFSPLELRRLGDIGNFHQAVLSEAEAILVIMPVIPGYLGDIIQSSRLASVLVERHPEKVYVNTDLPHLFGKYPLVEIVRGTINGKLEIPFLDSSREPLRIHSCFMPIAELRSLSPGMFLRGDKMGKLKPNQDAVDLDKLENIHQLHYLQALWELMYSIPLDKLPTPAIKIAPEAEDQAKLVFETLPISPKLNIIVHPDSSNISFDLLYEGKKWLEDKWAQLLDVLSDEYPEGHLFVSVGTDHPDATQEIIGRINGSRSKTTVLPRLGLPAYASLIDQFAKDRTIFIGLESMPAGHLAPSLGLKSIVLSDVNLYCRFYGPWGGIVVANNHPDQFVHTSGVEVSRVLEAVRMLRL